MHMSPSPKKHDVFISFRGEDTRGDFTSHLHHALRKEDINTYVDYNLKKGDKIWRTLAEAIHDSHIALIVFSENYASSKWCLDELLEILECRKHHGQVVIPVFYRIDPSHVRKQTGSYERAFARFERELRNNQSYEHKLSQWKFALTEAANISGWDSSIYRDDSQVIEDIVKDVWQNLSLMYPNEPKGLVEIDQNSNYIESLLKKFPRIGIWGMGGIGKTTIARKVFAKHFAQYDSVCFLEKVREESEKFGPTSVRNKLLSELLKRHITTSDVLGHTFIQRRLSGKKVFIVLDDVDNAAQLEYLCGELGNFGPHSRLVVTTKDRHALIGRVDTIYEVREWKFAESLKLFSLRAFEQSHPKEGYECLSERAVAYAGGVPLALNVLGLHFRSRNTKFWESELSYFENKEESMGEIRKVLQASYKGLPKREQAIFLDIAFFFKDENKDFITRILDACGFNATGGIENLEDKALITVSKSNRIQMHDLLQIMGLDIVRYKESRTSRDPGKRNRLRDIEEVCDVLQNNKGTDAVEGITLDLSQKVDLHLQANAFKMMTKLRFLRLYVPLGKKRSCTVYHPTAPMPFPNALRYFEWNGYPFKSLPLSFCAKLLVEIRLPHSNVQYLWHDMQELVNLEGIDLSDCKQLMKLPDFSRASKLKWLYLSGCESLCAVEPSVFTKDTLVTLLLDGCKQLQNLMSEEHLRSLEKINVHGCLSLKDFSLSSDSIVTLDLSNTGVEILHSSIGHLRKLEWLNLDGLRLKNLPDELSCLTSLTELWISNCSMVTKSKLQVLFSGLKSLQILYLKYCDYLSELPANISFLSSLYELRIDGSSVEELPTSIKYLTTLEIMSLDNCRKLHSLPELPPYIKEFYAENCTSLVTVFALKTSPKKKNGKHKYILLKHEMEFDLLSRDVDDILLFLHYEYDFGTPSVSVFPLKNCLEKMNGKEKYISLKNDLGLDRLSLDSIMEVTLLAMKFAAFHNMYNSLQTHSYNYNSAKVCLPGSKVPGQFKYRTKDSSITIELGELSYSLGFIFSVVVSPSYGMKVHDNGAKIQCQCYREDGRKVGYASTWHHKTIADLSSDHVYVWYDPYHFDSIHGNDVMKVSFEFCVITDTGEDYSLFSTKECGICPIYLSESPSFVDKMNVVKDLERMLTSELLKELGSLLTNKAMQFESESVGRSNEREGSGFNSIERCDQREGNGVESNKRCDERESNDIGSVYSSDKKEGNGIESIKICDEKESNGEHATERCNEKDGNGEAVERCDEKESNCFSNEKCCCPSGCLVGLLWYLWRSNTT